MDQSLAQTESCDSIIFVSLGMVVLDELHFPSKPTLLDVPGGSGLFATIGARAIESGQHPSSIGTIIVAGDDFPDWLFQRVQAWKVTTLVKNRPQSRSTRGSLHYHDSEFGGKVFEYLTPPLRPRPVDLHGSNLLRSRSFHFLETPQNLDIHVPDLLSLRKGQGVDERPLIAWEPAPLGCKSSLFQEHLEACKLVDIFSPNHLELARLVGSDCNQSISFSSDDVEQHAAVFVDNGIGPMRTGLAVVRCGEHGCLILNNDKQAQWFPVFHDSKSHLVVDTTGAGNTFLGGFTVGLIKTGDVREAAIMASVAASFAIEQIGIPQFSPSTSASKELWNGESVSERVEKYRKILASA